MCFASTVPDEFTAHENFDYTDSYQETESMRSVRWMNYSRPWRSASPYLSIRSGCVWVREIVAEEIVTLMVVLVSSRRMSVRGVTGQFTESHLPQMNQSDHGSVN